MKKVFILIIISFLLLGCDRQNVFSLEEKYYGNSSFNELDVDSYNKLIENKESFAIFIYQPLCTTSYDFNKVLTEFSLDYQISFYKMSFANMMETDLKQSIKYYPSLVIFNEGKLVDFLDANSEEDINYYKNSDEFKNWFTSYVLLKEVNNSFKPENNDNLIDNSSKIDAELENIKYDENKANIYFFWGNGCPHCEKEFEFFESIKTEYGDYFTLHSFETWYDEENAELLNQFASAMGDKVTGVPYTIIGNKTFKGFSESKEKEFLEAIKTQYKNSYDVYFEKTS